LIDPIIQVSKSDNEDEDNDIQRFNRAKYGHKGESLKNIFLGQAHQS
jgi:hypothetical protein